MDSAIPYEITDSRLVLLVPVIALLESYILAGILWNLSSVSRLLDTERWRLRERCVILPTFQEKSPLHNLHTLAPRIVYVLVGVLFRQPFQVEHPGRISACRKREIVLDDEETLAALTTSLFFLWRPCCFYTPRKQSRTTQSKNRSSGQRLVCHLAKSAGTVNHLVIQQVARGAKSPMHSRSSTTNLLAS